MIENPQIGAWWPRARQASVPGRPGPCAAETCNRGPGKDWEAPPRPGKAQEARLGPEAEVVAEEVSCQAASQASLFGPGLVWRESEQSVAVWEWKCGRHRARQTRREGPCRRRGRQTRREGPRRRQGHQTCREGARRCQAGRRRGQTWLSKSA